MHTFVLATFILSAAFVSCSKEKSLKRFDPDSLGHIYTGKQGAGVEEPGGFFRLQLEDHGSLLTFNSSKGLPGTGSWEIESGHFRASFRQHPDNVKITLSGTIDNENAIYGTWGYGENATGGGTFYVENERTLLAKKQVIIPNFLMLRCYL